MPILHVLATLLIAPYVALAIILLAFGPRDGPGFAVGLHRHTGPPRGVDPPMGHHRLCSRDPRPLRARHQAAHRTLASALLCALAIASPVILVVVSGSRLDAGAILFLMPCIAAAAFGAWRVREERRLQHAGAA
jgi:hypothetical protein